MTGFDDPRGRNSEELAYAAESAMQAGDPQGARRLFADAARLEEQRAFDADPNAPRVRSILAISAVALWFKARELTRALVLARHFITTGATTKAELDELLASIRAAWSDDDEQPGAG